MRIVSPSCGKLHYAGNIKAKDLYQVKARRAPWSVAPCWCGLRVLSPSPISP